MCIPWHLLYMQKVAGLFNPWQYLHLGLGKTPCLELWGAAASRGLTVLS